MSLSNTHTDTINTVTLLISTRILPFICYFHVNQVLLSLSHIFNNRSLIFPRGKKAAINFCIKIRICKSVQCKNWRAPYLTKIYHFIV